MWPSSVTRTLMLTSFSVTVMMVHVCGHGRLLEPPSRSSMWRIGFNAPVNYQDNELFCGGVAVQYQQNGGKCGVCGDPWNGPRENEAGGKYAKGIITRKYDVGQVMNVTVDLTANHKGYFEFHLCPTDNPFEKVTHKCLAQYPLVEISTGHARYPVSHTPYNTKIQVQLQLPARVRCRACMLQWKYNAGNSWGTDPDGTQCVGCGNQEQFYGCADIAIGHGDVQTEKEPDRHPWYFEEETEWHFGVVKYSNGNTNSAAGRVFHNNVIGVIFVTIISLHLFTAMLV